MEASNLPIKTSIPFLITWAWALWFSSEYIETEAAWGTLMFLLLVITLIYAVMLYTHYIMYAPIEQPPPARKM